MLLQHERRGRRRRRRRRRRRVLEEGTLRAFLTAYDASRRRHVDRLLAAVQRVRVHVRAALVDERRRFALDGYVGHDDGVDRRGYRVPETLPEPLLAPGEDHRGGSKVRP